VVITDESMGMSQLLRGTYPGCYPKVYAYAQFIHSYSFIHWENLYSASSRGLLRGASKPRSAK